MFATSFVFLWLGLGCFSAATLPVPTESRWAWLPIAAFFGPMWFFVATEMRTPTATPPSIRDADHRMQCACGAEARS